VRTVIEDVIVSQIIDAESEIYVRLWDAFEALKWTISHAPERGMLIDDLHWLYRQDGEREINIPTIVVIYTFTPDEVRIKFVLVKIPTVT
jgi:hypothetical protein